MTHPDPACSVKERPMLQAGPPESPVVTRGRRKHRFREVLAGRTGPLQEAGPGGPLVCGFVLGRLRGDCRGREPARMQATADAAAGGT